MMIHQPLTDVPARLSEMEPPVHHLARHGVLGSLPMKDRRRIAAKLRLVTLAQGDVTYEPEGVIRDVFFPLSTVFSLSGTTSEGGVVEISQVGSEGIVGVEAALRTPLCGQPIVRTLVHVAGSALRMPAEQFAEEVDRCPAVNRCVRRYMGFFFAQLQLFTACNRHHTLEQRCARRLLTAQDLSGSRDLRMTQHRLAHILGVSRQSVDRVLQELGDRNILELRRGGVRIHSRQQLKFLSCLCYRVAKKGLAEFLSLS